MITQRQEMSEEDRARLRKLCDMATKTPARPGAVVRAVALDGCIYITYGDNTTRRIER